MGNPMTPFVPPAAAFIKSTVTLYASIMDPLLTGGSVYSVTSQQAKNDVFYLLGTSTNLGGMNLQFPANTEAKVFTIHNNLTTASSSIVMSLSGFGFLNAQSLYQGITTTWDFWPLGNTSATSSCWQRTSATNIAYNAN